MAAHTSFERLSAEGLAAALRSDALCVSGELAAFQAAARWLGADAARAPLAPDILQVPSVHSVRSDAVEYLNCSGRLRSYVSVRGCHRLRQWLLVCMSCKSLQANCAEHNLDGY